MTSQTYTKDQTDLLLAGKETAGTYSTAEKTKLAGIAAGATANRTDAATDALLTAKADLVGGLIPTAQLPALALETAVPVANRAAMLALTSTQVQPGDIAIDTSNSNTRGSYVLTAADPSVIGNWLLLNAPLDTVQSVNGQQGTIVLAKADLGLENIDNTADSAKPVSTAQAAALAEKADYVPAIPTTGGLVPIASYSAVPGVDLAGYGSDGLRSWKNAGITLLAATSFVVLEYINWYPGGGATDTDGPAAMTLRVGIEKAGGAILPVKWGGQDTVSVAPGATVRSDPAFIDGAAGEVIYTRTTATMASGNSYVFTGVADVNSGYAYNPVQDNSRSGTNYAGGPNQAVAPVRILGLSTTVKRSVALVGDSIMQGANHDQDAYRGGFAYALDGQKIPYVKIAHGGESAGTFAGLPASARRLALIVGCTDAIVQYGTNDFTTRSLAAVQTDLITIWQRLVRMGISRVKQTTITPRTTSIDSFATTGNQTPVSGFAIGGVRQQFNDWLRDGAPLLNSAPVATNSSANGTIRAGQAGHPLVGYIDVADAVESARNSGVWKAGLTNDGIHPYADPGRNAVASAVPNYTFAV